MAVIQNDVKSMIDSQQMTALQYTTILICFLMNMLDGMDVLVIAFSASSISTEWGVTPQALGVVFSAALVGMTLGALFIAPIADKIGRKKLILICAVVMGVSIYATSWSVDVTQLMIFRFISGLGIGGMLASVSTLSSEYAPNKSKDFWIGLVMGGYPIGAVLSGVVAAEIIPNYGWRTMFQFAGIATLVTIPIVYFFLAESLEYLVKRRPKGALEKVNRILTKMKSPTFKSLPVIEKTQITSKVSSLLKGEFKMRTLTLWLAFFSAFGTLYFLLSWIPKLTTAAGMPERLGIYSGTIFNLGSFIGILTIGALAIKFGLRKMIMLFFFGAAVLMCLFGQFTGSAMVLVMFALIGFTFQGGFNVLYAVAARIYPTEIRTTGIGWAIGAGRLGAVIAPIVAGYLVGAGLSIDTLFIIFAVPSVIAGIATISIKSPEVS